MSKYFLTRCDTWHIVLLSTIESEIFHCTSIVYFRRSPLIEMHNCWIVSVVPNFATDLVALHGLQFLSTNLCDATPYLQLCLLPHKIINVETAHAGSSTYVQLKHHTLLATHFYFAFENRHCTQLPPLGLSSMEEPISKLPCSINCLFSSCYILYPLHYRTVTNLAPTFRFIQSSHQLPISLFY